MKHILAVLVFMLSVGIANAGHLNTTLDDLLLLAESGVSDKTILAFIEPREITFTLDTKEIVKLRKAGLSEKVIQYLLAKSKQANLTYKQYMKQSVQNRRTGLTTDLFIDQPQASLSYNRYIEEAPTDYLNQGYYYGSSLSYLYPGYYYGPSLYLGFGRSHHALFDHHFVGLNHTALHHTGPYHDTSIHIAYNGYTGGHHTSQFAVGSGSTHNIGRGSHATGLNSGRSHSILGRSSHSTTSSKVHSTSRSGGYATSGISNLSSRHSSNRSYSTLGRSSHNTTSSKAHSNISGSSHSTSGISALSSRHGSNRSHGMLGHSRHSTTSSKAHSTSHVSSHSSGRSGGHGGGH